jgi:hypothetical protein
MRDGFGYCLKRNNEDVNVCPEGVKFSVSDVNLGEMGLKGLGHEIEFKCFGKNGYF